MRDSILAQGAGFGVRLVRRTMRLPRARPSLPRPRLPALDVRVGMGVHIKAWGRAGVCEGMGMHII